MKNGRVMITDYSGIYIRYLQLLAELIGNLSRQAAGDDGFLSARLSPDMLPMGVQARTAVALSLRACCADGNQTAAITEVDPYDSDSLARHITSVVEYLKTLDNPAPELVEDRAGFNDIRMPFEEYVNYFSLPNFFFHISMVYAIARRQGFSVTKGDFDGIHQYPHGFTWEK